jgi:carboxyl-terminal processing protease
MGFKSRGLPLILLFVALVAALIVSELNSDQPPDATGLEIVEEAWQVIVQDFVDRDELDPDVLAQGAIKGMIEALGDPHSTYFDPEQYEKWQEHLEGAFGGVGAQVSVIDGRIGIIMPLEDTPAERAGIAPGDVILEIDGESTEGMTLDEAVGKIRGKPGTAVILLVLHEGDENPIEIVITREMIQIDSVTWEVLPGGIAHIRVIQFTSRTGSEMVAALEELQADEVAAIILDLRNNQGGILGEAVTLASQFLEEGIVLYAIDNEGERDTWNVENGGLATSVPLAVLVNVHSASASEVVAGAIQDHDRGLIIGTTTFGKGSVNHLRGLSDGSAIYITFERWFTPNGRQIEGQGISPDEEVERTVEDAMEGRDPQLDRAIEYLISELQV